MAKGKDKAKPKAKMGAPTLYRPEYCELVVKLGGEGKSKTQIACSIGVWRETLDGWAERHPDFDLALKRAKQLEQQWWEDMGQHGLTMGKQFNATAFIFQMKNRFRADYTDVHKLEHSGDKAFLALMQAISSGAAPKV